jgi:hypothetical protein
MTPDQKDKLKKFRAILTKWEASSPIVDRDSKFQILYSLISTDGDIDSSAFRVDPRFADFIMFAITSIPEMLDMIDELRKE